MISNRRGARPSSSPIEHLREFAINTSKGIDVTQAPINVNTVVHAKNLTVNPDGSLSLRKPITYVKPPDHYVSKGLPIPLFDGTIAYWDEGELDLTLPDNACGRYYDYKGNLHTAPWGDDSIVSGVLSGTPEVISLNTSTILGNMKVRLNASDALDLIDPNLYDETVTEIPRYIKIIKEPGKYGGNAYTYVVEILNPEPNELRFGTDGELALDPNLVLDNPYAITDVYGALSPMSKGVVAYKKASHSTTPPTERVPDADASTVYTQILSPELIDIVTHEKPTGIAPTIIKHSFDGVLKNGSVLHVDTSLWVTSSSTSDFSRYLDKIVIEASVNTSLKDPEIHMFETETVLTIKAPDSTSDGLSITFTLPSGFFDRESNTFSKTKTIGRVFDWVPDTADVTLKIKHGAVEINGTEQLVNITDELGIWSANSLTVDSRNTRFTPAVSLSEGIVVLKAFGGVPPKGSSATANYYASWFATYDGIDWIPVSQAQHFPNTVLVKSEDDRFPNARYAMFSANNGYEPLDPDEYGYVGRPDILVTHISADTPLGYAFRMITLGNYTEVITGEDADGNLITDKEYIQKTLVSEVFYNVWKTSVTEFAYLDFPNTVYGTKLYHKKRIYSYGHEKFFNNIFVSGIDNFETLLYNVIDIDAKQSDTVTALVPWRDYLMSATTNAMYLHTPQDNGFLTKTVTTSLGIPKEDSKCCVPVLNGVIVKSNSKVYLIYPNAYAGTDDVLNLSPISQPVEEYLQDFEDNSEEKPFAFSTESEYILMLPYTEKTICLRYNYTTRIWCMCEYPVRLYDYRINNVEDVRLYGVLKNGRYAEFEFDSDSALYADIIGETEVPIEFEWDSGQKTDNIATRKQFTESKIVFSTEDELENFPMELIVAVDGDPNITRIDVRTDAPLIKTTGSVGVLGTNLRLSEDFSDPNVSKSGLIRQLIVRYSGRGRSIRHILRGTARSPFRMYEAYVRYKLIDNKR